MPTMPKQVGNNEGDVVDYSRPEEPLQAPAQVGERRIVAGLEHAHANVLVLGLQCVLVVGLRVLVAPRRGHCRPLGRGVSHVEPNGAVRSGREVEHFVP